jgi:hypothetical protein
MPKMSKEEKSVYNHVWYMAHRDEVNAWRRHVYRLHPEVNIKRALDWQKRQKERKNRLYTPFSEY